MTAHPTTLLARVARHPYAVPLLAATMLALVGAQIALVFKVPSWGNDEPAHTGYVAALAEGRLPTIETDIVDDPARFPGTAEEFRGWDEEHGDIWTANHPPLFHLAMVPVWWALSDHQSGMVITMRLANTLGFAAWLFLVGVLARELVPRRPAVAALAVVVAAAPTLVLRSAFFINDGWASASAVLLLLATVRLMRGDVTRRWVVWAVVAGTVAAGTRAQGVLVVAMCALALLVVLGRREGWRTGLGVAALVGGVPAAAFGWFFLRNLRLYGDLTGQDALLEKFGRVPVAGIGRIDNIPGLTEPTLATPIVLAVALLLVPVALARSVRRHGVRLDPVWVMLAVHALVTLQSLVSFLAAGGGFHDRYLMQAMPLLATVTAVGMLEVGRWWRAPRPGTEAAERRDWWVASAWAAVLLVWLAGAVAWLEDYYVFSRQETSPVDGPVPDLMVVMAACVGAALVGVMVRRARGLDLAVELSESARAAAAVPERPLVSRRG
ncbi:hypothetical protein J2X46_004367 [Nocardioides sp. BE266]|uniref:DUF2142 domain-containing protein n=1 Tax=Nocardioides sp. BE266 TaxID=2817725 RepID=UPI002854B367|nr:DUF2142 domain-containing protein [Nocardioides sp. BE266]MDR7255365.1 hypothetical protein [Nocardioides sp. BE266]